MRAPAEVEDHPWVLVTWGQLLPGDVVLAPNGTAWTVGASIDLGDGSPIDYQLILGGAWVWSPHDPAEPVQAWRFADAKPAGGAERLARGYLMLGGFEPEELQT